ncbi:MAG: cysteine desulfurase [Alphaproteobacteria bacterium]
MTVQQTIVAGGNTRNAYDVEAIRADFPILSTQMHGKPLVFLDSGASAQKPQAVLDAMNEIYTGLYANVHRGVYYLSQEATARYEATREKLAGFINAPTPESIVFGRSATELVNLVAQSWGRANLKAGDEVIVTAMEHHANIVPWQLLAKQIGIVVKVAPIDDDGNFLPDAFEALLNDRTKLVAVTHVSNVLGTVVPVKWVAEQAHARGVPVLIDGCQGVTHMPVDVQDIDCDFYVIAGHKLYGPTGIGAMYGRPSILADMPPWQGGGDMIATVSFEEETTFQAPPLRFEAGTPPFVEAIGLGAAIDYISAIGMERIAAYEHGVTEYARERLGAVKGVRLIGNPTERSSIVSFVMDEAHAHDVGTILDRSGIAVRVGHHCAMPLMDRFGLAATARASFGLYNTSAEVDTLADALRQVSELFGG